MENVFIFDEKGKQFHFDLSDHVKISFLNIFVWVFLEGRKWIEKRSIVGVSLKFKDLHLNNTFFYIKFYLFHQKRTYNSQQNRSVAK